MVKHLGADGQLKSGLKLIGAKLGQKKQSGRLRMYACEPEGVETYVEPFLGSGNVLVGKPVHPIEVVGDINHYVINFYKALQTHPEQMYPVIERHVRLMEEGGAEYFKQLRDNPPKEWSVEGCAWYYAINKYCFNGIVRFNEKGECNSSYCGTTKGRGIYTLDWYLQVVKRVEKVHFRNDNYWNLLDWANEQHKWSRIASGKAQTTWVVLDPPYWEVFTKYDKVSFSKDDHRMMHERLKDAKYKWLLTINDVPEVRELYSDFNFIAHDIFYCCSQTPSGRGNSKELIITNYEVNQTKLRTLLESVGA